MLYPSLDGEGIRYLRIKLKMTVDELAALADCPVEDLIASEEGRGYLTAESERRLRNAARLAEDLGHIRDIVGPPQTPEPTEIGRAIRRVRLGLGLSIREAAKRAGVHFNHLHFIEVGKIRHPKKKTLQKIAAALGVTLPDGP